MTKFKNGKCNSLRICTNGLTIQLQGMPHQKIRLFHPCATLFSIQMHRKGQVKVKNQQC